MIINKKMGIRITPEHKYYNGQGVEYISVTQLLAKYKQPFDSLKIATRYAEKNGKTAEYWMALWENGKNKACDRGHVFHDHKEEILHGRGVDVVKRAVRMVRNQYIYPQAESNLYNLPDGIYAELQMWDDAYKLAGTGDKIHIETLGLGYRYVDIDDHKTNKRIDLRSYQFQDGSHKMMLHPVGHMMDCNLTHYELQISFYAYMLEKQGFIPRTLTFTHYPPPEPILTVGGWVQPEERDITQRKGGISYQLKYRKKEVMNILMHYTKQRRNEDSNRGTGSTARR